MQHICQVLGLTPDTAESAVAAAVSQWLERAKAAEAALAPLKNRVAELEKDNAALVESQVEADLEKYAPRFAAEKRDSWKKALLANRAGTIELLESLPEPPCGAVQYAQARALAHDHVHDQKTPPIHNRATARHPASVNGLTADPVGRAEEQRKAVLEYKNRCRCTWQEAWDALKTERPEMFHENS